MSSISLEFERLGNEDSSLKMTCDVHIEGSSIHLFFKKTKKKGYKVSDAGSRVQVLCAATSDEVGLQTQSVLIWFIINLLDKQ